MPSHSIGRYRSAEKVMGDGKRAARSGVRICAASGSASRRPPEGRHAGPECCAAQHRQSEGSTVGSLQYRTVASSIRKQFEFSADVLTIFENFQWGGLKR